MGVACVVLCCAEIIFCTGTSETIFCMTCCLVLMIVSSLNKVQCMFSGYTPSPKRVYGLWVVAS